MGHDHSLGVDVRRILGVLLVGVTAVGAYLAAQATLSHGIGPTRAVASLAPSMASMASMPAVASGAPPAFVVRAARQIADGAGDRSPSSVEFGRARRRAVVEAVSGDRVDSNEAVYYVIMRGAFTRRLARLGPGTSRAPTGSVLVATLDATTGSIVDITLANSTPDLAALGPLKRLALPPSEPARGDASVGPAGGDIDPTPLVPDGTGTFTPGSAPPADPLDALRTLGPGAKEVSIHAPLISRQPPGIPNANDQRTFSNDLGAIITWKTPGGAPAWLFLFAAHGPSPAVATAATSTCDVCSRFAVVKLGPTSVVVADAPSGGVAMWQAAGIDYTLKTASGELDDRALGDLDRLETATGPARQRAFQQLLRKRLESLQPLHAPTPSVDLCVVTQGSILAPAAFAQVSFNARTARCAASGRLASQSRRGQRRGWQSTPSP